MFAPLGFRHIRLRSPQNVPLELASLFVFTRLEEMKDTSDKTKLLEAQRKRQMLSNMVYYHIGRERSTKMEFIEVCYNSNSHDTCTIEIVECFCCFKIFR